MAVVQVDRHYYCLVSGLSRYGASLLVRACGLIASSFIACMNIRMVCFKERVALVLFIEWEYFLMVSHM